MSDSVSDMLSLDQADLKRAQDLGFDVSQYAGDSQLTRKGYREITDADRRVDWADYGRALAIGGAGVAGAIPALADYATQGAVGGDTRRALDSFSQDQMERMSPQARRNMNAEVLPDEGEQSIFENFRSSLGLQATAALPSIIASIIPSGLAVKVAQGLNASRATQIGAATGTARATNSAVVSGEVTGQIYSTIERMSDEELSKLSPTYAGYLSMMSPREARDRYMQEVAGAAPIVAGFIGAAMPGVETMLARRMGGEAAQGLVQGVRRGATTEFAQEAVESGVGEFLSQDRLANEGLTQRDWQDILSKGLTGGFVGAAIGGVGGGISGIGGRAAPRKDTGVTTGGSVTPAEELALAPAAPPAAAPVTPEVTSSSEVPADIATAMNAGTPATAPKLDGSEPTVAESKATLDKQIEDLQDGVRDVVMIPKGTTAPKKPKGMRYTQVAGVGAFYHRDTVTKDDILAAIVEKRLGEFLNMGPTSKEQAVADIQSGAEPLAAVVRKPDGTPVVEQATSSATVADDAAALQQKAAEGDTVEISTPAAQLAERVMRTREETAAPVTPEVTPAAEPPITQEQPAPQPPVAPVQEQPASQPAARRILEASNPEAEAATKALNAQINKRAKAAEKSEAAREVAAGNRSKAEKAERRALNEGVLAATGKPEFLPTEIELLYADSDRVNSTKARAAIMQRARAIDKAATDAGFAKLPRLQENVDPEMTLNGAVHRLKEAQVLVKKGSRAYRTDFERFLNNEQQAMSGAEGAKAVREERKQDADARLKRAKTTDDAANAGAGEGMGLTGDMETSVRSPEDIAIDREENDDGTQILRDPDELWAEGRDRPNVTGQLADQEIEKRVQKAQQLAEKGATEGERKAGAAAVERLKQADRGGLALKQAVVQGKDKTDTFVAAKKGERTKLADVGPKGKIVLTRKVTEKPAAEPKPEPDTPSKVERFKVKAGAARFARGVQLKPTPPAPIEIPAWAQNHADDTTGRVLFVSGDLALIEGFSVISGRPVYVAAKGDRRTRVDIASYEGGLFTTEEKSTLVAQRELAVASDAEAFKAAPNGPFVNGETVTATDGVSSEIVEVARGLMRLLGLNVRAFITTPQDARNERVVAKHNLYGPFGAIRANALQPDGGGARRLQNGDYTIVLGPSVRTSNVLEVLAHEIGHIVEKEALRKASPETQLAIKSAFDKWFAENGPKPAKEYVRSLRNRVSGKLTTVNTRSDTTGATLPPYWRSFSEWFADQVSKWATTESKPLTLVERFFAKIGAAYRRLAAKALGTNATTPEVRDWLNSLAPVSHRMEQITAAADGQIFPIGQDVSDDILLGVSTDEELAALAQARVPSEVFDGSRVYGEPGVSAAYALRTTSLARVLAPLTIDGAGVGGALQRFVRSRLIAAAGDTEVHVVTDAEMTRLSRGKAAAFYHPTKRYIVVTDSLLRGNDKTTVHVLLHEGIHAATSDALADAKGFIPSNMKLRGDLRRLMSEALAADPSLKETYAFRDDQIAEFLSEAMSNTALQQRLGQIAISADLAKSLRMTTFKRNSMWSALVKAVGDYFKLPNRAFSVLEAAMKTTEQAMRLDNMTDKAGLERAPEVDDLSIRAISPQAFLRTPSNDEIYGAASDRMNATGDKAARGFIKFSALNQLAQRFEGTVIGPALRQIEAAVDSVGNRIKRLRAAGNEIAVRSADLERKYPEKHATLVSIMQQMRMHELSMNGKNEFGESDSARWQAKQAFPKLKAAFDLLPGDLQKFYNDSSKYYGDAHQRIVQSSVDAILEGFSAKGKFSEQERAALTQRVMDQEMIDADKDLLGETVFEALENAAAFHRVKGDYFPLMRFGDFVVTTRDRILNTMGGRVVGTDEDTVEFSGVTRAAARRAAEAFSKGTELRQIGRVKQVYYDKNTGEQVTPDEATGLNDVEIRFQVKLQTRGVYFFDSNAEAYKFVRENPEGHDKLDPPEKRMGSGYRAHNFTGTQMQALESHIDKRTDILTGQKQLLKSVLAQSSIMMAPGNRVSSRRLKAQKVIGASKDFNRSLLQYNEAMARHVATSETMPQIRGALRDMRDTLNNYEGKDRGWLRDAEQEVIARVDQGVYEPNEAPPWMRNALTISSLARLFSPAYSMIQTTQPWMTTLPLLGGRFGVGRAIGALNDAYGIVGLGDTLKSGFANTITAAKDFNKIALLNTDDPVGNIRKRLSGDKNLTSMLDHLIDHGAIDVDAGIEVSPAAMDGKGAAGRVLAGFDRVARQMPQVIEAINRSVTAIAAYKLAREAGYNHEKATQYALDTVKNTQGDYSAANQPRFFNNPILRPAMQFKKYAQFMTWLMADQFRRAFRDQTLSAEEKKIARATLRNFLAVQIAVAGALSIPGLELIKAGFLVASLLGIGGGWDETEEYLKKVADDTFGRPLGQMITSGVITRLGGYGVDVSNRMSLSDMWLFGEPRKNDSESLYAYAARLFVGSPGTYAVGVLEGVRDVSNGDLEKGIAKMLPVKFAADASKAIGNFNDGRANVVQGVANTLGLQTAAQAESIRDALAAKRRKDAKDQQFQRLMADYNKAIRRGDQVRAIARNKEWNAQLSPGEFRLKLPTRVSEQRVN